MKTRITKKEKEILKLVSESSGGLSLKEIADKLGQRKKDLAVIIEYLLKIEALHSKGGYSTRYFIGPVGRRILGV